MRTRMKGTSFASITTVVMGAILMVSPAALRAGLPVGETIELSTNELLRLALDGKTIEIRTSTHELSISLKRADLRRRDLVARSKRGARMPISKAKLFVGSVDGVPGSSVRLAFGRDGVRGVITLPEDRLWIEPAKGAAKSGAATTTHRIASTKEVERAVGRVGLCDAAHDTAEAHVDDDAGEDAGSSAQPSLELLPPAAAAELRVLEVAIEVDTEFLDRFGASSGEVVDSILHGANEIFERELGISVKLSAFVLDEGGASRYRQSDPVSLLTELREAWLKDRRGVARDAVHLLTGRMLDGGSGGVAYVGTTCDTSWAFGLTHVYDSAGLTAMVLAHELAHNFGARHDERDSPFLMAPYLSLRTLARFSDATRLAVSSYAASTSCLDAWAAPAPEAVGNELFARGDANGDSQLDLADVGYILSYLFGGDSVPECPDAMDTDDDGSVSLTDALRVVLFLLSSEEPPSAPFPVSGVDPTPDRLGPCVR